MSEYFECKDADCMAYMDGHCMWKKSDKDKIDSSYKNTCPRIIEQIKELDMNCLCNDCKYADKEKMKCKPNSKDCNGEYNLEESDFIELKRCDFYTQKE